MIRGFLGLLLIVSAVATFAQENPDGQHDFDWEFGKWHTHLWRLKQPLSGSNEWVEYDGTTVVRKIWDGRANLVELEVDGPTHIEALNLRLYNPETHNWSLNFASSKAGTLGTPTVGEFKNGRGRVFRSGEFQRTTGPGALHHHLGHQNRILQVRAVVLSRWRQDLGSKLDGDRHACEGMTS
jgi:hypothetical protein